MGSMLRSDKMTKCQMYLQKEVVFDVLAELGDLECVEFIDLYPDQQLYNRRYVAEVCRVSEMEVKLLFVKHALDMNGISLPEPKHPSLPIPVQECGHLELMLDKWKSDIQEMNRNERTLLQSYFELCEFHYVLTYIGPMLGTSEMKIGGFLSRRLRRADCDVHKTGRLMVTTGVVRRSSAAAFELVLWRITHGIIYYKQARDDKLLIDPRSRKEVRKVAFLVVVQGQELATRVQKVCNGFQVNTFPCPESPALRAELQESLVYKILDLEEVLLKTKYIRCLFLRGIAKETRMWINTVKKTKAIYHVMNMFRFGKLAENSCLVAECWIPDDDYPIVSNVLERKSVAFESNVVSFNTKISSYDMPPTYHRVNDFTRGFQSLITAYGDSTYRELNPGLYTIITFPFLFALMFGDVGHGLILLIFGLWMWFNEKRFKAERSDNEIWDILFGGRYVIVLMGVFSVYTGFLYNDFFSRAFCLSESYWMNVMSAVDLAEDEEYYSLDPQLKTRAPYWFGEDPMWRLAKNKIMFENSFKMKMSIIIGVIHMMFGLVLSFFNYVHFKKTYAIFFQFIPEFLFLTLIFFWLVVMIFMKWFLFSPKSSDPNMNTACAPQILILFIDMALGGKETKPANDGCAYAYLFDSQRMVQQILLYIAAACLPVLLLGSPVYKTVQNNKKRLKALEALTYYKQSFMRDAALEKELEAEVQKYSASFSEVMIHQAVHTIEYVLSTISHTASYLRLWALSLAHSQLSEMLWEMVLARLALKRESLVILALIPIFALWAVFTVSVLVVMEGLSAFLHCLRLHWVEFMSKFYEGGGRPFRPFSFRLILEHDRCTYDSTCKKFNIRHYY